MKNGKPKRMPFLKLNGLTYDKKDFKLKSIYDLKVRIKDGNLVSTVKFLIKKIRSCDIDPEIYFMLYNAKNKKELSDAVGKILYDLSSRKYDDDARHILFVLEFLLDGM